MKNDPRDDLYALLLKAQRRNEPWVEVPRPLLFGLGVKFDNPRWALIPVVDGKPSPCGEFFRPANRDVEWWCLIPKGHSGSHGWAYKDRLGDVVSSSFRQVTYCSWCNRQHEEALAGPPGDGYRPPGWWLVASMAGLHFLCSHPCFVAYALRPR